MSAGSTVKALQHQAARDVLDEGADRIIPLKQCKAQEKGSSIYVVFPDPYATIHGLSQGSPVAVGYHPASHSVIHTPLNDLPEGVSVEEFISGTE